MSILFSLVIPVYNVELYIEKCLRSCLEQENFSFSEYEIILVDDGSPDNSIALAKKLVVAYPKHNVKWISRTNGGLSAARNTGLEHVDGKYVWFIDSDDWIASDSLHCLKEKIIQNKNIEILTFTHRTVYADGRISIENKSEDYLSSGFDFLSKNTFLSAWRCIYSVGFLKSNNLCFKEGILWEDSEFNLRVYGLVQNHFFFSKSLYYYLRRNDSITTKGTSYKMVNSWFVKVDSVCNFFKNKSFSKQKKQIINYQLAYTIVAAVAGFLDLSTEDRLIFRNKIKSQKKYYWHFFKNSGNLKIVCSGILIIVALPIAEYVFRYLVKIAIKKGEGI